MSINLNSLQTALTADHPITGLCVVADKNKCPPGYELQAKTAEGNDADLWRDSFFGKKTPRYFCYTRIFPLDNGRVNNVLADMALLGLDNPPPPGWSSIPTTLDSREPVLKKKQLCVRMLPRENTQAAVCDILLLAKAKRAPAGYTLIGELNGMLICLRLGPIPHQQRQQQQQAAPQQQQHQQQHQQQQQQPQSMVSMPPSYLSMPPTYSMDQQSNPASNLPYTAPSMGQMSASMLRTTSRVQRSQDLPGQQANPSYGIEGVPFDLNKRFEAMQTLTHVDIPEVSYMSEVEINNQYQYDFKTERQATQRII
ncbi:multivesicular body subunit 12B-like [Ptychodera flava]|uniref:multivesicular body subunit 12B-like n=1 Tax=Ptychodera flava TaxID=63121 RepID=UPI00396A39B3